MLTQRNGNRKEDESARTKRIRQITVEEAEMAEGRRRGRDGGLEDPGGSSGEAGNVSLWRGPGWLWTALIGFSFKHHDPGLEMKKRKQKD